MSIRRLRDIACVVVCGLWLVASSSVASAQEAHRNQRQLERAACRLVSVPQLVNGAGAFEAISVPASMLVALDKTNDKSLREAVRAYDAAAIAQDTDAMIRALADAAKVCQSLGLPTATE
jgi:hypothetical protein